MYSSMQTDFAINTQNTNYSPDNILGLVNMATQINNLRPHHVTNPNFLTSQGSAATSLRCGWKQYKVLLKIQHISSCEKI